MYRNKQNKRPFKRNNSFNNKAPVNILPPVSVLEKYEDLIPGSSEKIIDMVDVEQDHRQRFENRALTAYIWSYRLGQLISLLSVAFILYASIHASKTLADPKLSYLIIIFGFGFHLIVTLLSIKRKKFFEKPLASRSRPKRR